MPKPKWNLNTIYISERLQESLRPISRCAMTTVVAPMGYGKTTAVNWYLGERAKAETLKIIRISIYSGNLAIFWKSVQEAFAHAGFPFLREYPCPTDAAGGGLLVDDLCHVLAGETSCYIFIDDFHLLTDRRASLFLCMLANRLPINVHLIVASRDRFLPAAETVRLGAKVYQIGTEQLRLNHTELAVYAHRCGTALSEAQIESLLYSSEGWFSAVYLNLRTLSERGVLPSRDSDIYATFTAAMIDPLPEKQREFLAVMGLADEFTVEMAQCVTGNGDAGQILSVLTEQNAFVTHLPDGVTYRFHHMMKECAECCFLAMEAETQRLYWERFGLWYEQHRQYLHAIAAYRKSENYDALLRVIRSDAGILLASLKPEDVLDALEKCPAETLKAYPFAILVLMRRMFTWRQIPKMLELKALLLTAIEEHPELSEEERGNLLGECDLILSFLCYNDISAMSRLHGAETIMRAEALFCQGRFTDAHIELERAYAQVKDNGQINMALCCDFLSWRLSLHTDVEQRYTFEERYAALLRYHDASWINLWNATSAYYHALRGETDSIPEIFSQHRLSDINMLAPGKPMMEMIENQVYLAQGAYVRVVGYSAELLPVCEAMHYALVALHLRIQTAVAYEKLGKSEEAHAWLRKALSDAEPDGLVMPFVENYDILKPLLEREVKNDLLSKIIELGEAATARNAAGTRPAAFDVLTPREFEIVELMAQRLSNREIAEQLFLSEGSVKQYVNQIYSKLHIEGDTRTKRKLLAELLR